MKLSNEEILEKIEELMKHRPDYMDFEEFIRELDLTREQFEILAKHKDSLVRYGIAAREDIPSDLMYKLSRDKDVNVRENIYTHIDLPKKLMYELVEKHDDVFDIESIISEISVYKLPKDLIIRMSCGESYHGKNRSFSKLKNFDILEKDDLENAYDLIRNSKNISKKSFEKTFDFIINKFPELSELAKMFKRIILKGKKDLK